MIGIPGSGPSGIPYNHCILPTDRESRREAWRAPVRPTLQFHTDFGLFLGTTSVPALSVSEPGNLQKSNRTEPCKDINPSCPKQRWVEFHGEVREYRRSRPLSSPDSPCLPQNACNDGSTETRGRVDNSWKEQLVIEPEQT